MNKFVPHQSQAAQAAKAAATPFQVPNIQKSADGRSATVAEAAGDQRGKDARFALHPQVRESLKVDELMAADLEKKLQERWVQRERELQEKAHQEGYAAGLAQGREEAYATAREEARSRLETFESMMKSCENAKAEIFSLNERFLLDLTTQIASKLAKKTVAQDPEFLKRVILEVIEKAALKGSIKIRVSPQDVENVKTFIPTLTGAIQDFKNLDIASDESLAPGACTIQSEWGEIQTSLQAQFEKIYEAVVGTAPGTSGEPKA